MQNTILILFDFVIHGLGRFCRFVVQRDSTTMEAETTDETFKFRQD